MPLVFIKQPCSQLFGERHIVPQLSQALNWIPNKKIPKQSMIQIYGRNDEFLSPISPRFYDFKRGKNLRC